MYYVADMRDRLKALLEALCASPELEQQLLRTLSMLEFMGARKIAKSMAARYPSPLVLDHWADETRHAAAFARLAAIDPTTGKPTDRAQELVGPPLANEPSKLYFQGIDQMVTETLAAAGVATTPGGGPENELNYLLVTTIVERRAMMVYPLYRASTRRDDVRQELTQVITEEQSHRGELEDAAVTALAKIGEQLGRSLSLTDFFDAEQPLFAAWLDAAEHAAQTLAPPPPSKRPSARA